MSFTPPEHFVFPDLSVLNNLKLGGITEKSEERKQQRLESVYEMFPVLKERSKQLAGTMSGGQQRMVGLGIALMGGPRLMLLDEPSLGLAPSLVDQLMDAVRKLADAGIRKRRRERATPPRARQSECRGPLEDSAHRADRPGVGGRNIPGIIRRQRVRRISYAAGQ
jgi:hypothetical protein